MTGPVQKPSLADQQFYLIDETNTKAQFLVTINDNNYEVTVKKGKEEKDIYTLIRAALNSPVVNKKGFKEVVQGDWKVKIKTEKTGLPGIWRTVRKALRRAFSFKSSEQAIRNFNHTASALAALFEIKAAQLNFPEAKEKSNQIKSKISELQKPSENLDALKLKFNAVAGEIDGLLKTQMKVNREQNAIQSRIRNLQKFITNVRIYLPRTSRLVEQLDDVGFELGFLQVTPARLAELEKKVYLALPEAWLKAINKGEILSVDQRRALATIDLIAHERQERVNALETTPSPKKHNALQDLLGETDQLLFFIACGKLEWTEPVIRGSDEQSTGYYHFDNRAIEDITKEYIEKTYLWF